MKINKLEKSMFLLGCLFLSGCSSTAMKSKDPIEPFNRGVYEFNRQVDRFIVKPTAYIYKSYVPILIQRGVHNFFTNIEEVTNVANDLLQLKFHHALEDTTRFLINTTFGIGGLFDVAYYTGLEHRREDFGQTLQYWGYQNSSYLVLPFIGPSTVRDTIGMTVDRLALSIWPWINSDEWYWGLTTLQIIDARASLLGKETVLDAIAVDEYSFIRDAYFQRRQSLLLDHVENGSMEDPFEDFDDSFGADKDRDADDFLSENLPLPVDETE